MMGKARGKEEVFVSEDIHGAFPQLFGMWCIFTNIECCRIGLIVEGFQYFHNPFGYLCSLINITVNKTTADSFYVNILFILVSWQFILYHSRPSFHVT